MPFTSDSNYHAPSIADIGILQHIDSKAEYYTAKRQSDILLDSQLFVALIDNDTSIAAIARIWGVSRQTISVWVSQYKSLTN